MEPSCLELDHWSVGVVILEILAGTELVIPANTTAKIRNLLLQCSEYLDVKTVHLLEHLLFGEHHDYLEDYLNVTLKLSPNIVKEDIRAIDAALDGDGYLIHW